VLLGRQLLPRFGKLLAQAHLLLHQVAGSLGGHGPPSLCAIAFLSAGAATAGFIAHYTAAREMVQTKLPKRSRGNERLRTARLFHIPGGARLATFS
jgi:hypothetical protein